MVGKVGWRRPVACLSLIGAQPVHPTTGDDVFFESLVFSDNFALGVSAGPSPKVSYWTWPALTYTGDYMSGPGLSSAVADDTNSIYVGALNSANFIVWKDGAIAVSLTAPSGPWAGGGLCWAGGKVWFILNYDAGSTDVGRLYSLTPGGTLTLEYTDSVTSTGTPLFTAKPNPATDGAVWWSNSQTTRMYRFDGTATSDTADDATAFMMAVDDGAMVGWSPNSGTWRQWATDLSITDPVCDPAAHGFTSFPIGSLQNADLSIRGMTDVDGNIWATV